MTFEEVIGRDGRLVYRIRGRSMLPMLREGRDAVVIEPLTGRAERYDVLLYRRGKAYVLHRVIKVTDSGYVIYGDNTYSPENVPDSAVIGRLTAFIRSGKTISVDNRLYNIYVRLWRGTFPVRYVLFRLKRLASKVKRMIIK